MKELVGVVALIVFIIFGALGCTYWGETVACDNGFTDYPHRYDLFAGCLVQQADGRWVPDDVFRVLE